MYVFDFHHETKYFTIIKKQTKFLNKVTAKYNRNKHTSDEGPTAQ